MSHRAFEPHVSYIPEPELEFRYGQRLAYPRDGLFLYGPVGDVDQLRSIRYGVIGTPEGVRRFRVWSSKLRGFIDVPSPGLRSRAVEPQHVPFPGFAEAFHAEWPVEPTALVEDLDPDLIHRSLHVANRHEAVRTTVDGCDNGFWPTCADEFWPTPGVGQAVPPRGAALPVSGCFSPSFS